MLFYFELLLLKKLKFKNFFMRLLDLLSQTQGVNIEPHLSLLIPKIELLLQKQNPSALRLLLRLQSSVGKENIVPHFEKNIINLFSTLTLS